MSDTTLPVPAAPRAVSTGALLDRARGLASQPAVRKSLPLVGIAAVMLSREQASVGFQATLQVRNKLLSAYKDIMSMPV